MFAVEALEGVVSHWRNVRVGIGGWNARRVLRWALLAGILGGVIGPSTVASAIGGGDARAVGRAASPPIVGEELARTNARAWQVAGFTGRGVRVAVVDAGFGGYADLQSSGALPGSATTASFCRGGLTAGSTHGSAVAEVVHRMAPEAQLYLVCALPGEGLAAAVRYLRRHRVQVVASANVYSVRGRRHHGRPTAGSPDGIVGAGRKQGILWVNAAGNFADAHWAGPARLDRHGYLRFTGRATSERLHASGDGNVVLRLISSVANPARRYSVLVTDHRGHNVAGLFRRRVPGEGPSATYFVPNPTKGTYTLRVRKIRGPADRRLELFFEQADIDDPVSAGSIPELADAPGGLAVGAVCWARERSIEFFSSRGPSVYGQTKPDLVAPDAISTFTYGPSRGCYGGFSGTSASASVVAGAAALVRQRYPRYGPGQLASFLKERASVHVPPHHKNNTFGAGFLRLPPPRVG